jgi:lysophospholipase L1-like esterase
MLTSNIKRIIAKIFSKFNVYFNYPGLRFETIDFLKKFKRNIVKANNSLFSNNSSLNNNLNNKLSREKNNIIICLGDSNTFGWNYKYEFSYPFLLERNLLNRNKNIKVLNFGIGGYTVKDGYEYFKENILKIKPKIVIINYGLNDGRISNINKNQIKKNKSNYFVAKNSFFLNKSVNLDIKLFEAYFLKLQKILVENEILAIFTGIYKIKRIKIGRCWLDSKELIDFQNDIYKNYDDKVNEIALKNDVVFFDLWNILRNYKKIDEYLHEDGFHLNKIGFKIFADNLTSILKSLI